MLPADNAAYGFDNNADALSLSPALPSAIWARPPRSARWRWRTCADRRRRKRSSCRPIATRARGSATICRSDRAADCRFRYYFPADGEYPFEVRPKESGADGGVMGLTDEPHQLETRSTRAKSGRHHRRAAAGPAWIRWIRWKSGGRRAGAPVTPGAPARDPAAPADQTCSRIIGASSEPDVQAQVNPARIWFRSTSSRRRRPTLKICSIHPRVAIRIAPATASRSLEPHDHRSVT